MSDEKADLFERSDDGIDFVGWVFFISLLTIPLVAVPPAFDAFVEVFSATTSVYTMAFSEAASAVSGAFWVPIIPAVFFLAGWIAISTMRRNSGVGPAPDTVRLMSRLLGASTAELEENTEVDRVKEKYIGGEYDDQLEFERELEEAWEKEMGGDDGN